jgi:hypothetical protein
LEQTGDLFEVGLKGSCVGVAEVVSEDELVEAFVR